MSRLRTVLEWTVIIITFIIIGFLVFSFFQGTSSSNGQPSGLPDGYGGFYQTPLSPPQEFTKSAGGWHFTLLSSYRYTLAGKVVGKHDYPAALPDGIIPVDIAVVNGDLLKPGILSFFKITMGDHTLEYSYDIPTVIGLTEQYIDEHISNNHLVFLDPVLESNVKNVEVGDCIVITGKLVDIRGTGPTRLYLANTSTVRNDAYPAGCEVILVESYETVNC